MIILYLSISLCSVCLRGYSMGKFLNGRQVMGVEDAQAFKEQGEWPGERGDPAGDRRRQRDFAKNVFAAGEELADFSRLDTARLRVGGVEPEIVPQDQAAGFERSQHLRCQVGFDPLVQDRRKSSVLQQQVKGGCWKG